MKRIPLMNLEKFIAYSFNEMLVVFLPMNGSLHVLDDISAWVFLSIDSGVSKEKLEVELVENKIDPDLLNSAYITVNELMKFSNLKASYRYEYQAVVESKPPSVVESTSSVYISLLGRFFQVESKISIFNQYLKELSFDVINIESRTIDYHLELNISGEGYKLSCNSIHITHITDYSNIMPILMDHIQILAYQSSNYLLAVHSAVLSKNNKGLMLPGKSGSGKSTLAVSLLAKGYQCYSDEVTVISERDNQLMPLPLPAAVKSGSWEVLRSDFPDMKVLTVWQRPDGRRSKYIDFPYEKNVLPQISVDCIFFPFYDKDRKDCNLIRLNSVATLKNLTTAGYQIKDVLTDQKVMQLLEWVDGISAYELHYSNLEEAHCIIEKVMSSDG